MLINIVLIGAIIIFLFCAIYWEIQDFERLGRRPKVWKLPLKEKEKEYKFHGTFNYRNNVVWRSLFIQSIIITILIYYLCFVFNISLPLNCILLILITIFLVSYLMSSFRVFHLYRKMASKVDRSLEIL